MKIYYFIEEEIEYAQELVIPDNSYAAEKKDWEDIATMAAEQYSFDGLEGSEHEGFNLFLWDDNKQPVGLFEITVEYNPSFYASKKDLTKSK